MTTNEIVVAAIQATPTPYLTKTLTSRNDGPECLGSKFLFKESKDSLICAKWEPYEHPAIQAPAKGFICRDKPGYVGVVRIDQRPEDEKFELVPSAKGTGFMDVVVKARTPAVFGPPVEFTVALIGPGDDGRNILWTVFPGDPIAPSTLPVDGEARPISKVEALKLGFEYAKIQLVHR